MDIIPIIAMRDMVAKYSLYQGKSYVSKKQVHNMIQLIMTRTLSFS